MNTTTKLAGAAGLVWTVANLGIGMSAGTPPELDAPAPEIQAYLTDHRSMMMASALAFALTIPALLAFFGTIIGRMRTSTQPDSGMATTAAGTGLGVFIVAFSMAYTLTLPLVLDEGLATDAENSLVTYLWMGTFLITMIGNIGFGSLLVAIGLSPDALGRTLRRAAVVIGVLSIAVSAVGLVNTQVAVTAGLSFVLLAGWMAVTSIGFLRDGRTVTVPQVNAVAGA